MNYIIDRDNLIICEHNQLHRVIFPCICMLTGRNAWTGGRAAATQSIVTDKVSFKLI